MKQSSFLIYFLFVASFSFAQNQSIVTGKVVDTKGKGIYSVNVKIIETNQYSVTNENGDFRIKVKTNSNFTLEFSYIGFQKITKQVKIVDSAINLGNIVLKELNLSLETIEVNAKRNYEGSSNSSLIIGRDIIEQIPALSLNDLLNQIPNRKITAPGLQDVQNITLRGSFSPTSTGRNIYEMNNAFGVAIIMDGNTISNNMNMQSFNTGRFGSHGGGTNISIGSYGLNGNNVTKSYTGDFAYSGLDLRQIPADQIENIEVVAGVASAKYGDLTDGAIIVERQAGKAPAYVRMQLRDNATSYGFSKGFGLGKKLGALNIGANYVKSFADNRDKLKAYNRLNLSSMYTNYFDRDKRLKNTLSVDYGQNLDGVKRDPDEPMGKMVKFDSWNFSVGNRTSYNISRSFLKNIGLNLRYATGHQTSYTEEFYNEPYILASDATTTGIHEGYYLQGIYTAQSLIDGRPLNITARLDLSGEFKTGNITHFINFGGNYSYGANKGLGQVLDPTRPRGLSKVTGSNSGNYARQSDRYYDFSIAIPQKDLGFYIEDVFTFKLLGKNFNTRAGLRYDIQNNLPSFAPRINLNYELTDHVKLGFAYGLSYKSPALGQRYPGPTYFEASVINAYSSNGKAAESLYLVYVDKYTPTALGLKPANSQTFEFSSQIKIKNYNVSINAYHKDFKNGIGNTNIDRVLTLPVYEPTFRVDQKPLLTQVNTKKVLAKYYKFDNNLKSNNQGFDFILTTPTYSAIATSFNISGGLTRSHTISQNLTASDKETPAPSNPNYGLKAYYPPANYVTYYSSGRISSTTHIPKISLFIQGTAEFDFLQKTINKSRAGIPVAYSDQNLNYITITNFDQNNPNYGHFYKPVSELNANNVPRIVPNFHLSIGKEIKKRFKLAFNVYNVFNYQPYYIDSGLTYKYPNQSPTFGAELSLKL